MKYIGFDIGASRIRALNIENFEPQKPEVYTAPTPTSLEELEAVLRSMYGNFPGEEIAGIGFSIAGAVSPDEKHVLGAANARFLDGVSRDTLLAGIDVEKRIDNDARCFLRAEILWGAARGKRDVLGLVFGTGIGAALWRNGQFVVGNDGLGMELGHVIKIGDLAWEEAARRSYKDTGDASDIYAEGIREAIRLLHPESIVIGGGPISAGAYDLNALIRKVGERDEIQFGALGDAAQAIGAALLFR